jgi:hypothetical protein
MGPSAREHSGYDLRQAAWSVIPKSGHRFSEKIMLK